MNEPVIMLVDNGSRRAASTRGLRALAAALAELCGCMVHPVSLQHADHVAAEQLDGRAANVFPTFVREQLQHGERRFIVVPLFFGPSRALSSFIPQQVDALSREFGQFAVDVAEVLVPMPRGEVRVAQVIADQIGRCTFDPPDVPTHVVLTDHGSPLAAVTEVRHAVARDLASRLPRGVVLSEAVMERRPGPEYDFNGPLLEQALERIATESPAARVAVGMMFVMPGRHAGEGGDVAEICATATNRHPGLQVAASPLLGEHPLLLQILRDRLGEVS